MKFGDRFSNLLRIKCTKLYAHSFRFDIFIARCLGGYFFPDTLILTWVEAFCNVFP